MSIRQKIGLGQIDLIGLDIGSSAVKMVQLSKDGQGFCATAAAVADIELPETTNTEQDPTQNTIAANTVRAIDKCLEGFSSKTRNAVCGLCGPDVMVRDFSFPNLPTEAIEQAVMLEAQQVCPLDIKSSVVDYQLINSHQDEPRDQHPQEVRGIFVVATNDAVEYKKTLVSNASVKSVLMDVEGLALLNCLEQHEQMPPGNSAAIVNVGKRYTNIAILGSEGLPFVRDLPVAADDIINQIANVHNISAQTVEKVLRKTEDSAELQSELKVSLQNACQTLITDISETLRYYTLQEKSSPIGKIFVCGGFALVEDFVTMLDEYLTEPVTVMNPFSKMRFKCSESQKQLVQEFGPAMAVAAGLAMRTV